MTPLLMGLNVEVAADPRTRGRRGAVLPLQGHCAPHSGPVQVPAMYEVDLGARGLWRTQLISLLNVISGPPVVLRGGGRAQELLCRSTANSGGVHAFTAFATELLATA